MLAADGDNTLTAHDMASEATWADKLRDANIGGARLGTRQWHFVDIELADGDEDRACFGHPAILAGSPAYPGVAQDCVVDKVGQFQAELADPRVGAVQRLTALKFLLHFVGDLHQPLHSSDDGDRGGNDKRISDTDTRSRNLHAFWDTTAVRRLGADAPAISAALVAAITPAKRRPGPAARPRHGRWRRSSCRRRTRVAGSHNPTRPGIMTWLQPTTRWLARMPPGSSAGRASGPSGCWTWPSTRALNRSWVEAESPVWEDPEVKQTWAGTAFRVSLASMLE